MVLEAYIKAPQLSGPCHYPKINVQDFGLNFEGCSTSICIEE